MRLVWPEKFTLAFMALILLCYTGMRLSEALRLGTDQLRSFCLSADHQEYRAARGVLAAGRR
jgi:hypothetical protein